MSTIDNSSAQLKVTQSLSSVRFDELESIVRWLCLLSNVCLTHSLTCVFGIQMKRKYKKIGIVFVVEFGWSETWRLPLTVDVHV